MNTVRLGLIGDNIMSSSAPRLHMLAAAQHGIELSYELIIPAKFGFDFDGALDYARARNFRGVNITLPYKEKAFRHVHVSDPAVRRLGSVNTICFDGENLSGYNTDYTGFLESYRSARGEKAAGDVLLIGAGGVGRSVAFALLELGATRVAIIDKDKTKAERLVDELNHHSSGTAERIDIEDIRECDAVINCSPAGMHGYGGLPLPEDKFPTRFEWAFDAVYQPVETPFRKLAEGNGVRFISGFELFFHQGVDAFSIFTGHDVKEKTILRNTLLAGLD